MYSHPSLQTHHLMPSSDLRVAVLNRRIRAPEATAALLAALAFGTGREDQPMLPSSAAQHLRIGLGGAR